MYNPNTPKMSFADTEQGTTVLFIFPHKDWQKSPLPFFHQDKHCDESRRNKMEYRCRQCVLHVHTATNCNRRLDHSLPETNILTHQIETI